VAGEIGAQLRCLGHDFDFTPARPTWSWRGAAVACEGLAYPPAGTPAQLRNASVVLAAIEAYRPGLLADTARVSDIVSRVRPPGRFQRVVDAHEWILDVAHNPQAVATLRAQLDCLPPAATTTVVIGILGDKSLDAFATALDAGVQRWICCGVDDPRARDGASIAARLRELVAGEVVDGGTPEQAFALARERTPPAGRIVVCGSFRVVGPALRWLGIY